MMGLFRITFSRGGGIFLDLFPRKIPGRKIAWIKLQGTDSRTQMRLGPKSLWELSFLFKKVLKMDRQTISELVESVIDGERPGIDLYVDPSGRKRSISLCKSFDRDTTLPPERLFGVSGLDVSYSAYDPKLKVTGTMKWEVGPTVFEVTAIADHEQKVLLEVEWAFTPDYHASQVESAVRKLSRIFTAMRMKLETPIKSYN